MKLLELFEAGAKHVTFCFGRLNPPTIGHEQLLATVSKGNGDHRIFLSQSQDKKKNPLDYATKIKFLKLMFPSYAKNIVEDTSLNTIGKVCSYLYDQGYKSITVVGGSDRVHGLKKLIDDYNGVEGKAHGFYKFDNIDMLSSGERDPDADGIAGVSASGAREAAAEGDFEKFAHTTGAGHHAEELYNAVRQGMGINEDIDEAGFLSFLKTEPPKKKWNPAKDSRVVSNKKDDNAWIKLLLDKHRRGIELTDREWDSIKQWKLKRDMREAEGDAEGLPHLTKKLLTHIVDEIGAEGAHAIIKSLTWGDGAAKEFLHLIVRDLEQNIDNMDEHIVKVKGGYELKSKHGNKNLGKYPTKAGAEKRERQVQYFKHAGK